MMKSALIAMSLLLSTASAAFASDPYFPSDTSYDPSKGYYGVQPATPHTAYQSTTSYPAYQGTTTYTDSSQPIIYGGDASTYGTTTYGSDYATTLTPSYSSYAGHSPTYGSHSPAFEDEVITYEQRQPRRAQSYYFNPRDYRTFNCRSNKCTFEFRGKNAEEVEYYLAKAMAKAAGFAPTQTECTSRRNRSVTCRMNGDLSQMNPKALRQALYGR